MCGQMCGHMCFSDRYYVLPEKSTGTCFVLTSFAAGTGTGTVPVHTIQLYGTAVPYLYVKLHVSIILCTGNIGTCLLVVLNSRRAFNSIRGTACRPNIP